MTDTETTPSADVTAESSDAVRVPLDDVMIAMDVVDTLRHDDRIVARELDREGKRADLIERLREIYRGQGIEVPDRILQEGVDALEQDRFVYEPPKPSLARTLAKIYVTRGDWGRVAVGVVGGLAAVFVAYYALVVRPEASARAERQIALNETLPAAFTQLASAIESEAKEPGITERAAALVQTGRNAARAGNLEEARKAQAELNQMLSELRSAYSVRIVSRRGEMTGLWRVPRANPNANNYYLVVEAVGGDGKVIPQTLTNEETGAVETVETWAVRVDESVFRAVQADKSDDGIIQNAVIGEKARGRLTRSWSVPVADGFLTRW
jgi:hypothetical protein